MMGLYLVLVPLVFALILAFTKGRQTVVAGKLTACGLAGLLGWVSYVYFRGDGSQLFAVWDWAPSFGASLSFRINGLSYLMVFLVLGIGSVVFSYASDYLSDESAQNRFLAILMVFLAGMIGVVVSGNLIQLFVFWELTSLTSYLLIGHYHEESQSRWHALQALLVTGGGGVIMLVGFLMLGQAAGTYEIGGVLESKDEILADPRLAGIVVCLLIGAFTKSGQFPFHFWLPNAMSAPTPVSAFLHSATMVKAGVFLVALLTPVFSGLALWDFPLMIIGGLTMLFSAALGLLHTDLKKILAYTTLSVLGLLMMMLGLGSDLAIKSAMVFLVGHALYKSTLFMCAGSVAHATQTRDVRKLGGLLKWMPITAWTAVLAALSKSGFPPFVGFIGKEYVYKSGIASEVLSPTILMVAFVTNLTLLALAFKVGIHPFFARSPETGPEAEGHHPHDPTLWMSIGPLLLALAGLGAGLFPGVVGPLLVEPAVNAVAGREILIPMKLWHGFNAPLLISALTLVGGLVLYRFRWLIWNQRSGRVPHDVFEGLFEKGYHALLGFASWQTRLLQSGSLRNYFYWIIGSFALLSILKFSIVGWVPEFRGNTPFTFMDGVIVAMVMSGALFALLARSRFVVILALGQVGFGIAWIYAAYGAPDLAITQILVETLMVLLFVFAIRKMPRLHDYSRKTERLRDGFVALVCGGVVTLLVMKTQFLQISVPISREISEWSYVIAKGRNVVNVILVDFRALDTMGEVTVLGIAAIGVFVLLGPVLSKKRKGKGGDSSS